MPNEDTHIDETISSNPLATFVCSAINWKIIACNSLALNSYSYKQSDLSGLTIRDLMNLPNNNSFDVGARGYICKQTRKDGTNFYGRLFTKHLHANGKDIVICSVADVEERFDKEERLRNQIKEVENIIESMSEAFYRLDKNWNITYVNKKFEEITGTSRENIIGRKLAEMFPFVNEMPVLRHYQRCIDDQVPVTLDVFYEPLNYYATVQAYPTNDGIAVFVTDRTEQRNNEIKISKGQQQLTTVINNTEDLIWSVDTEQKLLFGNDAFYKMVSKHLRRTINAENVNTIGTEEGFVNGQHYERALNGESFTLYHEEDDRFYETGFNPIFNSRREVTGVSCFSRDVTDVTLYQQKIEAQNLKLKEIARMQSHNLRNHVANILGLIYLYADDPGEADKYLLLIRDITEKIDAIIKEMSKLINDEIRHDL